MSSAALEGPHHALRFEPLAHEIPIEPPELGVVRDAVASPKASREGSFERQVGIDRSEHAVDGPSGRGIRDASLFELAVDPKFAVAPHRGLPPRNGLGRARIVDGALLAKPGNRRVDRVRLVALSREPLPHLRFRQFSAREHLECVEVGLASRQIL